MPRCHRASANASCRPMRCLDWSNKPRPLARSLVAVGCVSCSKYRVFPLICQVYYCHYISTIQNHLQSFPQFLPLDNFLNSSNPPAVMPSTILRSEKFQSAGPLLPENDAPRFGASIPAKWQPDLGNTPV